MIRGGKKEKLKIGVKVFIPSFGISWKMNMSVCHALLLMKSERWRAEKHQAGRLREDSAEALSRSDVPSMNFYQLSLIHKLTTVLNQF